MTTALHNTVTEYEDKMNGIELATEASVFTCFLCIVFIIRSFCCNVAFHWACKGFCPALQNALQNAHFLKGVQPYKMLTARKEGPALQNSHFSKGNPALRNAHFSKRDPALQNAHFSKGDPALQNANFSKGHPALQTSHFSKRDPAVQNAHCSKAL